MLKICAALFVSLLLVGTADAQSYQGTGNNWGSGWQSDGRGGLQGTGKNWGSGYQSYGRGGLQGTGKNWGSGWQRNR